MPNGCARLGSPAAVLALVPIAVGCHASPQAPATDGEPPTAVTVNHDVQDLVVELSKLSGAPVRPPVLPTTGPFTGVFSPRFPVDAEELAKLATHNVRPRSWGAGTNASGESGFVLVTHTAEVQSEVAHFFDSLRSVCALLRETTAPVEGEVAQVSAELERLLWSWHELEPARRRAVLLELADAAEISEPR